MNEPATLTDVPADASGSEAELAARIDAELGITGAPVAEELPTIDEPAETPEEPAADPSPSEPSGAEDPAPTEPEKPGEEEPQAPLTRPSEPEAPAKPAPADQPEDELFLEVEDAAGEKHKIQSIEDLPEDFMPKNNRQIFQIIRDVQDLAAKQEQRETERLTAAEQAALEESRQAQFNSWDNEISELAKEKRIDTTDSKRIDDVFGYMNEINTKRLEAGNNNLITSFEDALEKFEAKEARDAAETAKKNDNERAKAKASLIGRSSARANGDTYVYKSGSARSIDDIPVGL